MSEKYAPVAFNPRAFAEEACKHDPVFREAYEGMAGEVAALKARILANPEARAEHEAQAPEFDQVRERIGSDTPPPD